MFRSFISFFSTTIWVAIPAWSTPGIQSVSLPCILFLKKCSNVPKKKKKKTEHVHVCNNVKKNHKTYRYSTLGPRRLTYRNFINTLWDHTELVLTETHLYFCTTTFAWPSSLKLCSNYKKKWVPLWHECKQSTAMWKNEHILTLHWFNHSALYISTYLPSESSYFNVTVLASLFALGFFAIKGHI